MIHLTKYSKPYLVMIFVSIALLYGQANFDLALPDYLSNIVNVGIQQGGVENAVPVAIRQSEMNRVALFLTPENNSRVLGNYTLINSTSANYADYVKNNYINESIYILSNSAQENIDALNPIIARALLTVYSIEQIMQNATLIAEMKLNTSLSTFATLLENGQIFNFLQTNPAAIIPISSMINQKFEGLGETMIIQAGINAVRAEYKALGMDTDKIQNDYILRIGGIMLLFTLLSVFCTILVSLLASKVAVGMGRDIRKEVFKKVESFSSTEFDKFSTASLITRSTNDITQLQMVVMMIIRLVFYAPIMGVGGVIRAMGKASSMWWIIALAVIVMVCIIFMIFSVSLPKFKITQKLVDRINLVSRENLSGMMVIRAFNREKFEEKRFDNANTDLTKVNLFTNRTMVIMMPMMMLIMNGLSLAIIWVGAHEVADATMQVGDMMAFMQYAMQIVISFLMMSMMFIMLPRASVSATRIAEVLSVETQIRDPENPRKFPENFHGEIEFRNVSFRYPGADADALQDITFVARPGQTTAFIGSTGAGKSTIVNLIPRFYDITKGSILVDGVDIREVTQADLRNKIGYVPQKSSLFSGTIASNLYYADENATDEKIQSAINIAQARELIASKSEGMNSPITQGGVNVSGGQKQRLSIARALVKRPPIYILDDSVSALDFKTDIALRKALKENVGHSTILLVTQRVSSIKTAEQIIVLDDGKIVGKGTHAELMKSCTTYKEIALSQLSKEELE